MYVRSEVSVSLLHVIVDLFFINICLLCHPQSYKSRFVWKFLLCVKLYGTANDEWWSGLSNMSDWQQYMWALFHYSFLPASHLGLSGHIDGSESIQWPWLLLLHLLQELYFPWSNHWGSIETVKGMWSCSWVIYIADSIPDVPCIVDQTTRDKWWSAFSSQLGYRHHYHNRSRPQCNHIFSQHCWSLHGTHCTWIVYLCHHCSL